MATFDVDVEGATYQVDAPDELTAWKWAKATHRQEVAKPKSTERTWGEAAKDIGAGIVSGTGALAQLPGQLSGLAGLTEFDNKGLMGVGKDIQKYGEEMKSAGLKAREEQRAQRIQEAEKSGQLAAAGTAFAETIKDPALLLNFLAEQAPQLIVPFGAAKVGAGVAGARAVGKGIAAEEAAALAGKAGAGAAVGAGAVQQGADIGAGAYEDIYKELISKNIDPADAKESALNLARAAGASGAIISLLAQRLPGARTLEEALAGVPGKTGRLTGGLKGALGEAASEIAEETGGKFSSNLAMRDVKADQELTEGLGQTAGMAAIGGVGMGGISGLLQRPSQTPEVQPPQAPPQPPVAEAPPTPPVAEAPPVEAPPTELAPPPGPIAEAPPTIELPPAPTAEKPPVAEQPAPKAPKLKPEDEEALRNYTQGLPEGSGDVFAQMQNRDRGTPASIQQMQGIAQDPDYDRLKTSADFGSGAPVVISDIQLSPEQLGRTDVATGSDGRKIPVQYAVVDANDLLPSHTADGRTNNQYGDLNQQAIRPVAGNGRVAGLQLAYNNNTASDYRAALQNDTQHGVSQGTILDMERPVLVRIMPKSMVTPDIGDVSNVGGQLRLSPVEAAKNDGNRINLGGLQFNEDGGVNTNTLIQFVRSMPKEEQGELMDKNGMPNSKAIDRLNNAIFFKAYGSDSLIDLYAQAADPEAKLILQALARAASKMAQLDGAGEYDIRQKIIDAAELAVNARRNGIKLKDYVQQGDIGMDPYARQILEMFAENGRSGKRMGEMLSLLADEAAKQTKAGDDMFGAVPKLSLDDVFKVLKEKPTEPDLFNQPKPAEPKPTETKTKKPAEPKKEKPAEPKKEEPKQERKIFQIAKSGLQVEGELAGKTVGEVGQWLVDNAPNSVAKYIAEKVTARINDMTNAGMVISFEIAKGNGLQGEHGSSTIRPGRPIKIDVSINNAKAVNTKTGNSIAGTNYKTILHELLHTATQPQTWVAGALAKRSGLDTSTLFKELTPLLEKIRRQAKKDVKEGKKHAFLDKHGMYLAAKKTNPLLKNVSELISYGLTENEFQDYLKTVNVGKGETAFSKLVDLFRQLLNIEPKYKSALEELARITDEGLNKPIKELQDKVKSSSMGFYTVGKQSSKSKMSTTTDVFKRWFGDSKIVGKDGKPLEVYHGTDELDKFEDAGEAISQFDGNMMWFAKNPYTSNNYATSKKRAATISGQKYEGSPTSYPVYLSIKNPLQLVFDLNSGPKMALDLAKRLGADVSAFENAEFAYEVVNSEEFRDAAEAKGYDGVVAKEDGETTYAAFAPNQIKSVFNKAPTSEPGIDKTVVEDTLAKVEAGAKAFLQKRKPFKPESFEGIDEDFMDKANPIFRPQRKTIIDRIEGLRDGFWRKMAQGIADQYRTIKDYDENAYMLARMSKTIDGALEGLMFFGEVFNDGGALNIKDGTKGLIKVLEPLGKEVDRYQMWIALNRESQLPANKRSGIDNLEELVARRDELIKGDINGKPRKEVYEGVRKEMNKLNRSVLKVAVDAGLIDSTANAIQRLNDRIDETINDTTLSPAKQKATVEDLKAQIEELRRNPIGYERFIADINYIPFYREMEDGDISKVMTSTGLSNQHFSKALEGGESPFADLMENTLRNWSHILSASMKNQASKATVDAAVRLGGAEPNLKQQFALIDGEVHIIKRTKEGETSEVYGDGSVQPWMTTSTAGAVKVMIDGQAAYYKVLDPMLLESITSIGYMGPKSKFLDVSRDFKNWLQFGVTLSPAFKIRNLFRDSISAMAISDLKKNPFANVVDGWIATDRNNPAHISALAGGAIFNFGSIVEGDQAKLVKRLVEMGVPEDHIILDGNHVKNALKTTWAKYQDWGNKSEAANRMALYNQLREKNMSHLEASFYARDLLDFSMQGAWPAFRLLTQVVPFLNARVQGLYKLGKDGIMPTSRVFYNTITGKPIEQNDRQKAESFTIVTSAVMMASLALYFAFKDDEDYKKRDEWDRDNFWWFKLPNMDVAFRIPKPFEVGAFGTMAERVAEQIFDQGAEGKQFKESLGRMITDTFAVNFPQVVKPLLDLYANKDSFTGAPIESAGMERLSKQERATDTTSPIAKALGGMSSIVGEGLSPVQVDYAIKAYFGWLGGTVAEASHYAVMPFKDGAYPDAKWVDRVSVGFIKTLPSNQSRYVTAFYENNKEISQAMADMRHYAAIGQMDKVQEIMEEKGDQIALAKLYDKTTKQMSKIREQIRVITNDESMDGATKREEIDRMKELISMLAEQAEDIRKQNKL